MIIITMDLRDSKTKGIPETQSTALQQQQRGDSP